MEELEQGQSDAIEQASSEPADIPAKEKPESEAAKAAEGSTSNKSEETSKSDENVPFHKHPRWVERDNELKAERAARQQLEQNYQQMQAQLAKLSEQPKGPDKREAMLNRLKGIDPEFAEFVKDLAPAKELEEMRQWRANQEQQRNRDQALGELERLHQEHKVDAATKARYNQAIQARVQANPSLKLSDLAGVYKEVHADYSQWVDSIRRSEREAYVKAKQDSSAAPASQPRGTPVKQGGKQPEWSKNKDEARQQLIQRVLAKANASSDV